MRVVNTSNLQERTSAFANSDCDNCCNLNTLRLKNGSKKAQNRPFSFWTVSVSILVNRICTVAGESDHCGCSLTQWHPLKSGECVIVMFGYSVSYVTICTTGNLHLLADGRNPRHKKRRNYWKSWAPRPAPCRPAAAACRVQFTAAIKESRAQSTAAPVHSSISLIRSTTVQSFLSPWISPEPCFKSVQLIREVVFRRCICILSHLQTGVCHDVGLKVAWRVTLATTTAWCSCYTTYGQAAAAQSPRVQWG